MDAPRDPAFFGEAVLPSEDDEPEEVPQATLKLLSDFPEPLTEPQRRSVQRYVAQQVREFELVRQQVAVVERGYLALRRLVKRLRSEQARLQASLRGDGEEEEVKAKTPTVAAAAAVVTGAASTPAISADASTAEMPMSHKLRTAGPVKPTSTTKEPATVPKRKPGGLLLRSSVFSGLQRVLQAAKTEQHDEKVEQLAKQRERIAKESRLHLVSQDLASQEALLEPLQRKYDRATVLGQEAADKASLLMTLLEDMWRLESLYPSRFSMHATAPLEPLMWAGGTDDEGDANAVNEELHESADKAGQNGAKAVPAVSAAGDKVPFVVPFAPAQYSSDVEDLIRSQVEDIIDEYLAYRTRIDPVLYQLEQAQQAAKAQKVDQLMDVIGIKGAAAGAEVLPLGEASSTTATGSVLLLDRATVAAALAGKSAEQLLHISSSDDDEDVVDAGVTAEDAADKDRQDREQIRTALTALDDFEDA
jgi:hypothetical protein